jgi:hypothetical protein
MESGREQNYWPGFVDALSNVVLTLVFVLVIFVFALVMASNKVEKKMQEVEQAEQAHVKDQSQMESVQTTTTQQTTELRQQLDQALAEIEKLRSENAQVAINLAASAVTNTSASKIQDKDLQIVVDDKASPKVSPIDAKMQQNADSIIINYPLTASEIDDKTATELGHTLDTLKKKYGTYKILLRSSMGKEAYSTAQRLAYYRAMGIRNLLITKGYGTSADITSTIVQPKQPEDGHVEIVFQHR